MVFEPARGLRIDGDSHFLPPVNLTDVAEIAGLPESALDMLLRDAGVFGDPQARRGGFRATAAGQAVGAENPTAATTQQELGPVGHGVAEQRVQLLPDTGFDMQVLIADGIFANAFGSPIGREWGAGLHLALCMSYNNAAAAAQNEYPNQLIACGVLPFGTESIEANILEARRAVNKLGVKALMINSNWRGDNWDTVDLYPFWDEMNTLGIPIYVHGNPFSCQVQDHVPTNWTIGWERMRRLHISNYLGFGFEYMINMASLTLGGLLNDFPNLKFAFFEAGASWLPWVTYSLDRVYDIEPQCARCTVKPSELILNSCYVAAEPDEDAIVGAIKTIGNRNYIIGSDYPHPPSTFPNTAAGILDMPGLTDEDKEAILGGNLRRLFKLQVNS
ncbi:MAG: amidohydrolase family protein [Gammaproteobacteria bacterium]|nr:amidohydrolase family protein [Gammaproteobacteria bacterium]